MVECQPVMWTVLCADCARPVCTGGATGQVRWLMALALIPPCRGKGGVATVTLNGPALTNVSSALNERRNGADIPQCAFWPGIHSRANPRHLQGNYQVTGQGDRCRFEQRRAPDTVAWRCLAPSTGPGRTSAPSFSTSLPTHVAGGEPQGLSADVFHCNRVAWPRATSGRGLSHDRLARRPPDPGPGWWPSPRAISLTGSQTPAGGAACHHIESQMGCSTCHPHNIAFSATPSTPAAYDLIAQSDCIVCFGHRLHDF